jgi:L-ascorbate metabolism protein UlaG (beta-lactamase superfamily)
VNAPARPPPGPRNPWYRGPVTDHFDGRRFRNPDGTPHAGPAELARWMLLHRRARWPARVDSPHAPAVPPARVGDLRVTMIGHASLLVQVAGLNLLLDPIWSERASPLGRVGPRRRTPPGVRLEDLPPIDLVLLSHNHYDHMDAPTLARLHAAHAPRVVTCLGNDAILRAEVPGLRAEAHDWGAVVRLRDDLAVRLLPCHHWSSRRGWDKWMALWCAFLLETPAGRLHLIGDTAFDRGRPYRAAAWHGPIRLAAYPIGAYTPRFYLHPEHQTPEEAVRGMRIAGAAHAVAHHWGCFQMTDEPREEPPARLAAALDAAGIPRARFRALLPGEGWDVP